MAYACSGRTPQVLPARLIGSQADHHNARSIASCRKRSLGIGTRLGPERGCHFANRYAEALRERLSDWLRYAPYLSIAQTHHEHVNIARHCLGDSERGQHPTGHDENILWLLGVIK